MAHELKPLTVLEYEQARTISEYQQLVQGLQERLIRTEKQRDEALAVADGHGVIVMELVQQRDELQEKLEHMALSRTSAYDTINELDFDLLVSRQTVDILNNEKALAKVALAELAEAIKALGYSEVEQSWNS